MQMRILHLCGLFLLLFANVNLTFAVTKTVCSSGCDFTTIQAAVTAASSGDTIHINVNGTHTENNITIAGKNLVFRGNGMNATTVQGHANRLTATERIFQFVRTTTAANPDPPITASIFNMSLRHGYGSLTSSAVNAAFGGAIFFGNGGGSTLTLTNLKIYNNDTRSTTGSNGGGAGLYMSSGNGAGIFTTITNCTFDDNNTGTSCANSSGCGQQAGAIYASGAGFLTMNNCIVTNNTAFTSGAAIYSGSSSMQLNISNTLFEGNNVTEPQASGGTGSSFSGSAGAIYARFNEGTITNCLFKNNSAPSFGGAVVCGSKTSPALPLIFTNCTFTGNSAPRGGAIYRTVNGTEPSMFINCTVANNSSTIEGKGIFVGAHGSASTTCSIGLINCIVANNTGTGSDLYFEINYDRLVVNQKNYMGTHSAAAGTAPTFDYTSSNATLGLSALANNGGPTETMALTLASTLRNVGVNSYSGYTIPTTDQRNFSRSDGLTDLGAFEYVNACSLTASSGGQTNLACNGGNTGSATVTPAGGTTPYSYAWSAGGSTTATASSLTAGTYTVTVSDAGSCTATQSFTLTQPTAISLTAASQTNIACNGGSTGAANVNAATGGAGSFTYNWTPGNPTGDGTVSVTGLTAQTYTCIVTDANSCTASRTFTITQPPAISLTAASQTNIACNGGSTGAANVNAATGGAGGFTYDWTPGTPTGDGTVSVTGLTAQTYTCIATDANSCTASRTFTITQPPAISLTAASQTNIACNGGSTGAASVNAATGGAGSFTYNWTPGNPTGDGTVSVTGLTAGSWTCTVTDANSCTASRTFTITQPTAISLTAASQTNIACNGGSTGAASVNAATGGAGGFTYDWTPGTPTGDGTVNVTGLTAGSWTCTVTDANSCTASRTFTITQPPAISLTAASQTNIACNGGSTGAASVNAATGGAGSFTYNWTPGNPTGDGTVSVTGLTAQTYTCIATDANSCTASRTFTITQPPAISLTAASQTNIACNGGSTGAASVNAATGGAGSFTYNWTPGNPTGDGTVSVTGLSATTYTVVATDANSCTKSVSFNITQPTAIVLTPSATQASCAGNDGTASVSVSGGTPSYTYLWSNGQITATITGLTPGTYTVTVTDANSCSAIQTATVTINDVVPPVAVSKDITVYLGNNGTITVAGAEVNDGSTDNCGNLSYSVSPNTFTCANLGANAYTLTVTDGGGNTATSTGSITVLDTVAPVATAQNITLALDATGNVTLSASMVNNGSSDACGIASISVSPSSFDCTTLGNNTVTLTVVDVNNNSSTTTATVLITDTVKPDAQCQNITLYLDATGNANTTAAAIDNGSSDACSGVASLSLSQTAFTCANQGANNITLTVTDNNGNSATCAAVVTVVDTITPTITCPSDIAVPNNAGVCGAVVNFTLPTFADNCTGTNTLTQIAGLASGSTFPVGNTINTFVITDGGGFADTCSFNVTVADTSAPVAICKNINAQLDNSGNVTIAAADINNGSTDNCGIETITVSPNTFNCSNLGANTVTLTVTDTAGNFNTCTATVTVQDTVKPVALCKNITAYLDATGSVSITANDIDNGSSDACSGIASISVSPTSFACGDTGVNSVVLTVTDNAGNTATCIAVVTVADTIAPVIVCPADITVNNTAGTCGATVSFATPSASENCVGATTAASQLYSYTGAVETFTVPAGVTEVTIETWGAQGQNATVGGTGGLGAYVKGKLNVTPGQLLYITVGGQNGFNGGGTGGANGNDQNSSGSIGNAGNGGGASDVRTGGFAAINRVIVAGGGGGGGHNGVWQGCQPASPAGNGGDAGIAVGSNGTLGISSACNCGGGGGGGGNGATQAAGGQAGGYAGNTACLRSSWFAGQDGILAQGGTGSTAYHNGTGGGGGGGGGYYGGGSGANGSDTTPGGGGGGGSSYTGGVTTDSTQAAARAGNGQIVLSWDAVPGATVTQIAGLPSGSIFPGGTTVNTFVATDASGNTDTCSFNVTVSDTSAPVAACKNITVTLDNTGNITVTGNDIDNGSTDNCGIATRTVSPATFNCNNIGPNAVTLTVTDSAGNSSTCNATVTVNQTLVIDSVVATSNYNGYNVSCVGASDGTATVYVTSSLPLNYQWSNGDNTQTATNLSATTYSVTVTTGGCADTATVTLNEPPTAVSATAVVISNYNGREVSCFGASDGILAGSGAGGIGTLQYAWNTTPVQNSDSAFNVPSGTYTLTVTDVNGCTATATDVVDDPPLLTSTAIATTNFNGFNISCNGGNDGAVQLTTTGGTGTYIYAWPASANAGNTTLVNALRAGTYVVTVTDINGCTDTASVTLTEPSIISLSLASFNPTCGASNGYIAATATGGASGYTYAWNTNPVQTTDTASGLNSGTYVVTVTDINGCTATNTATLFGTNNLQAQAIVNKNVNCFNGKDGSAQIVANGGTQPVTYTWPASTGIGNVSFSDTLAAGTYTVTVSDANGCSATVNFTITEPTQLGAASAVSSNYNGAEISCFGGADGKITATATGGTPGYTYNWSSTPVQTGATATGLAAAAYTVTITDANGCTTTAGSTLSDPAVLAVSSAVTSNYNGSSISCFGAADGGATVTATSGTGTYTYTWPASSGVGNTPSATTLSAGVYQITVSDANGCSKTTTITVTQPTQVTASTTVTQVSCVGGNDGTATVTGAGGLSNYSYNWSTTPAQNTATATGLAKGTYSVTVIDINGCTATANATITEPLLLVTQATNTGNVACFGGNTGSGLVFTTGGTAPYNYAWPASTGVGNTATGTNLAAGTYVITVTDDKGCSKTATLVITEPTILGVTTAVSSNYNGAQISCNGAADGKITATVSGGTTNYTYTWSSTPVQTGATATNLAAGTYTVTISDANGCTATASSTLTNPAALTVSSAVTSNYNGSSISCFGAADGTATVTATGGTGAYTYTWPAGSGVGNSANGTALAAGTYQVTVSDANNCSSTTTITVTQPTQVTASTTVTQVSCFGGNDGTATVTGAGGLSNYSYNWSTTPAQTTATATGLAKGTYTVTVADINGCTATANATITEPSLLITQVTSVTNVACFGGATGGGSLFTTGGTSAYSYAWPVSTGVGNSATGSGIAAGTYVITVTDSKGCTATATLVITQPAVLAASSAVISNYNGAQISCNGAKDGTLNATATGGSAPYTFVWGTNPAQSGAVANNVGAGTYTATVTDVHNCSAISTVTISEPTTIVASGTVTSNYNGYPVSCFGNADGSATISATGGTGAYTYAWPASSGIGNVNSATTLAAGTYAVTVKDANQCFDTAVIIVTQPAILTATTAVQDVKCFGGNDGKAWVTAGGGIPAYSYNWSTTPAQTTDTASALVAGTYSVTVSDVNGCTITASATVGEPALLVVSVAGENVTCPGGNDGKATTTVVGGTIPYTYVWNTATPQTTTAATQLTEGTYTVTVTDGHGCTATDTAVIEVKYPVLPTATISGGDTICAGQPMPNVSITLTGFAPYTFTLHNGNSTQLYTGVTTSPFVLANAAEGTYYITGFSDAHCAGLTFDTVSVLVNPIPEVFVSGGGSVCDGDTLPEILVDLSGAPVWTLEMDWANGRDTVITGITTSPYTINPTEEGTYVVKAVTDGNGCKAFNLNAAASVSYYLLPLVDAGEPKTVDRGFTVLLDGKVITAYGGFVTYDWTPDSTLDNATLIQPTARPFNTTLYTFTATDKNGCKASDTVTVSVSTRIILDVINIFTPDNDGINEFFVIRNLDAYPLVQVTIVNRWGQLVFKSDNYNNDWNGTWNGKSADDGTYYYVIKDPVSGTTIQGPVTILRKQ